MYWLPHFSHTSHHPSQTPCLPWISYDTLMWVDLLCLAFLRLREPACFHWELCLLIQLWSQITRASRTAESELISSTISLLSWQRLSFWSSLSTLGTNFTQIFLIFSSSRIIVYSSHTDIKLCTYCFYRHTVVLNHEILYLTHQLWCIEFLTPPIPLIIHQKLPAFLEFLMSHKNWCSIHAWFIRDGRKAVWSIPYVSVAFCSSLKENFIAYRSFKVSDCIFEIHLLWQSGFSRVYSNSYCGCWFEHEI